MNEERRKAERIYSWDIFEPFVLAIQKNVIIVGNISDISDTGLAIQVDSGNYKSVEIGSTIRCLISGSSIKDVKISGKIIRVETVASNAGTKGLIAIEFSNSIRASEQVKLLVSVYSKSA
ncbi:type IV pilus assembly protein PilZ [Leptospira inadai serovar Lyme str. 10]|uniref:Type IV pilus assembly protein PilZ n=2 Tax=Leptospira inadai serovar Lyme TaxID=293084 RepID=V6HAP4_9LEPT|nr:PilZ domain-containing protein [Leptospira inadai]EQA36531.1 type IV pilus assembly protein PilZ [Leptospira inadai serovar Lyme str. 10]